MSSITIDKNELKALMKQALIELLEERDQALYDALAELVEDAGLVKAIEEGLNSGTVDRATVFKALDRDP